MKYLSTTLLVLFTILRVNAQKTEQYLNYWLGATKNAPFYYGVKEPKDGKWYREIFLVRTGELTMKSWYADESCQVKDGEDVRYYEEGKLRYVHHYTHGIKDGQWMNYHKNGRLSDSSVYKKGIRNGIALGWDEDGNLTDSTNLDQQGNGSYTRWHPGGGRKPFVSGSWQQDTIRVNRWTYHYPDGRLRASIEFENDRPVPAKCECFDEQGNKTAAELCTERQAEFKGGESAWGNYMSRKVKGDVPVRKGAPIGIFTVLVQFTVSADGTLEDLKTLTQYGFGMEEEAMRVIRSSPKWIPALQFGRNVKAYRIQPVSFAIVN